MDYGSHFTRSREGKVKVPRVPEPIWYTPELEGLRFDIGWQVDRMARDIPIHVSSAWLVFAIIWLCVLLFRVGFGDWGTALGFAQVVAAAISFFVMLAGK